jgi:hypothetical protein
MRPLGGFQTAEAARVGKKMSELRLAQLSLEELARVCIDQIDAALLEVLMELADGNGFAALLAATAPTEHRANTKDGRAEGEARDETMNCGLHGELSYQRSYLGQFAPNTERSDALRVRAGRAHG